jgi:hypothetical protein
MVIRGLSLKPYPERYFAKTSHGYYVTYQKFDNETKTHCAAMLASKILGNIPLTEYRCF